MAETAYKLIRQDGTDLESGRLRYEVGATFVPPEGEHEQACVTLRAAFIEAAHIGQGRDSRPWRVLKLAIADSDVVAREGNRVRVRRAVVLREIALPEAVEQILPGWADRVERAQDAIANLDRVPWCRPTRAVSQQEMAGFLARWHDALGPYLRGRQAPPRRAKVVTDWSHAVRLAASTAVYGPATKFDSGLLAAAAVDRIDTAPLVGIEADATYADTTAALADFWASVAATAAADAGDDPSAAADAAANGDDAAQAAGAAAASASADGAADAAAEASASNTDADDTADETTLVDGPIGLARIAADRAALAADDEACSSATLAAEELSIAEWKRHGYEQARTGFDSRIRPYASLHVYRVWQWVLTGMAPDANPARWMLELWRLGLMPIGYVHEDGEVFFAIYHPAVTQVTPLTPPAA